MTSEASQKMRRLNRLSIALILAVIALPFFIYRVFLPWIYSPENVSREFHKLLYHATDQTWNRNKWLGTKILKNPFDLWIVQEILVELKPDIVIEAGTFQGGSALYMATIMDMIGKGKIVTIDIEEFRGRPAHPRIQYLIGSSTSPEILDQVRAAIPPNARVMVALDSDHHRDHVLKELQLYSPLVTKGSYLIVEDTNINGNPVLNDYGPGPGEALAEFMKTEKGFESDLSRERLFVTFNPKGYLKKKD